MDSQGIAGGGEAPRVSDVRVVALYDPQTGRIAHVHTVTVFEGGREVSEREAIETAKGQAERMGHRVEGLEVKVSRDPVHGRSPHRIDTASGEIVAVAARSPAQRRQFR